jgi:CRISPR/Cas system CMR-associated protein Cmr5 small subunit
LADVAGTAEERAKAEKLNAGERETREHAQAEQEIASIQKSKEYTAAEKQSLILKIRSNEGLATQASDIEKQAIDLKEQDRLSNERTALLKSENQNSQDIYRAQEALTTDRKKRAEIEKALVDLAIEQERIDAEAVIHSRTASDGEKALAEERMKMLPQLKALNEAQVARQNQSPFQSYVTNLREGLANVNDTLEQLAVDQIKKLEDTLAGATAKALGLHGALGEIVTALIRIGIQQAELAAFGGGGAGGGGIGSIFGAIGRLFGGGSGIGSARGSAFATDFSELGFAGGGRPPVQRKLL